MASAGATNWLLQEPPIGFCRSHQLASAGATNWIASIVQRIFKISFKRPEKSYIEIVNAFEVMKIEFCNDHDVK